MASTKWKNVEPEEHAIGGGVTVMIPVAAGESVAKVNTHRINPTKKFRTSRINLT